MSLECPVLHAALCHLRRRYVECFHRVVGRQMQTIDQFFGQRSSFGLYRSSCFGLLSIVISAYQGCIGHTLSRIAYDLCNCEVFVHIIYSVHNIMYTWIIDYAVLKHQSYCHRVENKTLYFFIHSYRQSCIKFYKLYKCI